MEQQESERFLGRQVEAAYEKGRHHRDTYFRLAGLDAQGDDDNDNPDVEAAAFDS
ncbi:hypothetical protein AAF712_015299 [Marasmius tenuissimus]|uniref:Uncharacterized protein n=1 Tax=Marasmius tenuissimus TaxID=585030 RepID=A0ABR2Z9T3_9AGAR